MKTCGQIIQWEYVAEFAVDNNEDIFKAWMCSLVKLDFQSRNTYSV